MRTDQSTSEVIDIPTAVVEVLESARRSPSGRAARTLISGAGAPLKQTLLAFTAGTVLADHEAPGAATLHVLAGSIRLTAGEQVTQLDTGAHAPIPPVRHGLDALDDAVVLITVAPRPDSG